MKSKFLTLILCTGIATIIISGCSFIEDTSSVFINKNSICSNFSQLNMNKMPFALVDVMTDGYRSKQKSAIDSLYTMDDARAIWFDLETLKQFIYQIEYKAKNDTSKTSSEKLGIRVYYANYPSDSLWRNKEFDNELLPFFNDPIKKNYAGLHTLVMIPTIRKDSIEMDFDPTNPDTYTNGIKDQGDPSQKISALGSTARQTQASPETGAQNHGNLYPPFGDSGMKF